MGKFTTTVEDHLVLPARVRLPPGNEYLLARSGRPVPAPVPIRLLIDTGARRTTLIPDILQHLEPTSESDVRVITPFVTGETTLYWVCLEFPGTRLPSFQAVLAAHLPMPPALSQFHGLLGRDL